MAPDTLRDLHAQEQAIASALEKVDDEAADTSEGLPVGWINRLARRLVPRATGEDDTW
jgi:hypothetical protein